MKMRDETRKIISIHQSFEALKSELIGIESENRILDNRLIDKSGKTKSHYFFLSYARDDDYDGKISRIKNILDHELKIIIGKKYDIFQDIKDINWGENWEKKICEKLTIIPFLIPFISPSFFNSHNCCNEIQNFLSIEKSRKRDDLILPIYFISIDDLPWGKDKKNIIDKVLEHNYIDLRNIRKIDEASIDFKKSIISLAEQAKKAINRI